MFGFGIQMILVVQDCIFNCHSSHVVMKYLQFRDASSELV